MRAYKPPKLPEYSYRMSLRSEELKVYKKIGLATAITLVVLIVAFFWGISFVNSIGGFWQKVKKEEIPTQYQSVLPLLKPRIEPIASAVNTEELDIKGYTSSSVNIELTLNGSLYAQSISDESGNFQFAKVKLKEGENKITFTATDKNEKESQQESITVILDKKAPKLELNHPPDGAKYGANLKEIVVRGITDPDSTVIVNDFQAIVAADGSFNFSLPLKGGVNKIKVVAKDTALNETTIERTVESDMPLEATSSAQPNPSPTPTP